MSNYVQELGDTTSHDVKPDFESGKGYYWMKQVHALRKDGSPVKFPRKPRQTLAECSFYEQVDRRLSRSSVTVNISFDKDGKRIHE